MRDFIAEYANENGFDVNNNFAVACYDQNSIKELACIETRMYDTNNIGSIVDEGDCRTWGITPVQWIAGVRAALRQKESDLN
jgi:hypothetical protein